MSTNTDFHKRGFDAGTQKKLRIYSNYLKSAIPVFLNIRSASLTSIHIYDFFSGPGIDKLGKFGSPLLAIQTILEMAEASQTKHLWGKPICFHFFDRKRKHIEELQYNISHYFGKQIDHCGNITIECKVLDFSSSFEYCLPNIRNYKSANILLIDQFGMAHFDVSKLVALSECYYTDCMLFMASSSLHRFKDLQVRFASMGYKFDDPKDYRHVHSQILKAFKATPLVHKLYFGSFAFRKKNNNIYGLIYFSGSTRGIDKFLHLCWQEDAQEGLADFFLHENQPNKNDQLLLPLQGPGNKTHIEILQEQFKKYILENRPSSEKFLYEKCCDLWILPSLCESVIKKLKENGFLRCKFRVPQPDQDREISYLQ